MFRSTPGACGVVGLLLNPILYGLLIWLLPNVAFLDRMAIVFFCLLAIMGLMTLINPRTEPVTFTSNTDIAMGSSGIAKFWTGCVVLATLCLYAFFW